MSFFSHKKQRLNKESIHLHSMLNFTNKNIGNKGFIMTSNVRTNNPQNLSFVKTETGKKVTFESVKNELFLNNTTQDEILAYVKQNNLVVGKETKSLLFA